MAKPIPPPGKFQLLERALSAERLGAYQVAVSGDLDQAVALYEWNSAMAGAFFEVLGHFEVVLRNALHHQLTIWHTGAGRSGFWYDDPARILDTRLHDGIAEARAKLSRARKAETPGRVVAELNFSFWRFLLDKRYQPILWAQALRHAFPNLNPAHRPAVYEPIVDLNQLRNRVAHHEPVHSHNLAQAHQKMLDVTAMIDQDIANWISGLSRVPLLLTARP